MQIDIRKLFKSSLARFYNKNIQVQQMKSGAVQLTYNPTWLDHGQGYVATVYIASYMHGNKLMYQMSDHTSLFRFIYHSMAHNNFTRYGQAAVACSLLSHNRQLIYDRFMTAKPITAFSSDLHAILNRVSRYFYWSQAFVCASKVATREADVQDHKKRNKAKLAAQKAQQLKRQQIKTHEKAEAKAKRRAKADKSRLEEKQFTKLYTPVMANHIYDSKHFGRKSGKIIPKALLLKHVKAYLNLARWSVKLGNKSLCIKPHSLESDFPIGTTRAQHVYNYFSKMPDYKALFK